MLIAPAELEAIRAGRIDLAFRRWDRPRLRVGTRMRTAIGLVEVTSVDQVAVEEITDGDARRAGAGSRRELLARLAGHTDRPVYRVGLRYAGADPRVALRERADLGDDEYERLVGRLDRLDRASRHGSWTRATLAIIGRRPGVRAPELALELAREPLAFKRDVRKLKELGLTESLETGYRLSPRAHALLRRLPVTSE
ncbi:MAG TPA: hypothetical protein VF244_00970 [Acidimicrobiales bacterium]